MEVHHVQICCLIKTRHRTPGRITPRCYNQKELYHSPCAVVGAGDIGFSR